ncbi:MAG: hypothetical protein Ct9H300mP12_14750 [Acidimicrobiales bacterium]|nr:MAG: hypothetical protein Ct9H300mP12_14750 [Acidimicrobiales bacterium]
MVAVVCRQDVLLWCQALAAERGMDCGFRAGRVAPGVQGPKADDTMADLLGEWVRDVPFSPSRRWYTTASRSCCAVGVERPGRVRTVPPGGLEGGSAVGSGGGGRREVRHPPGGPTLNKRIESDLFSYRADWGRRRPRWKSGLTSSCRGNGRDFIGKEALLPKGAGPGQTAGESLVVGGRFASTSESPWPAVGPDGQPCGEVRVAVGLRSTSRTCAWHWCRRMWPVARSRRLLRREGRFRLRTFVLRE